VNFLEILVSALSVPGFPCRRSMAGWLESVAAVVLSYFRRRGCLPALTGNHSSEEVVIRRIGERLRQTVGQFSQQGKFPSNIRVQLILIEAPAPVSRLNAWSIHPGLAAETEYILERGYAQTSRGSLGGADTCPVNAIFAMTEIRFGIAAFVLGCAGTPPTLNGIVIMSSRINDLAGRSVGQVHMGTFIAKAKLQDRHTRYLQAVPQSVDRRRDVAEILGEERQTAEGIAQSVEQVIARAIDPPAVYGGWIVGRNFPELVKSTEVVKAHTIAMLRCPV